MNHYKNLFQAFDDMDRYGDDFVGKSLRARSLPGVSDMMRAINRPSPASRFAPILKSIAGLARDQDCAAKSMAADVAAEKASDLAEARRIMPELIATANEWAASGKISALDAAKLDIRIAEAARELE